MVTVVLSSFGLGSSFTTEDMLTGVVEFHLSTEPHAFTNEHQKFSAAVMAPMQTLHIGEEPE